MAGGGGSIMSVSEMFIALQSVLTADQDIREVGAGRAGRARGTG